MDIKIRQVDREYLRKWPNLSELIDPWGNIRCYVAMLLNEPVGIILLSDNRIIHLHISPNARRTGVGTTLVKYVLNTTDSNVNVTTRVSIDNVGMQTLLIKAGFYWWGKSLLDGSTGWLFTSIRPKGPKVCELALSESKYDKELKDILDKVMVLEVAPVTL